MRAILKLVEDAVSSLRDAHCTGTMQLSVIHLEVDEDFVELLGSSPEQIERSALKMIVLELYRRH
jgi:hypothetical protein